MADISVDLINVLGIQKNISSSYQERNDTFQRYLSIY